MSYDVALTNAWSELTNLTQEKNHTIKFLADEYSIDSENRRILSLSCNVPTKDYISILILHYLRQKLEGLPKILGEWISFKQLDGGEGYYLTFKKRVIEPILRKYGTRPEGLLELAKRFNGKRTRVADISVIIEVFESVPILVSLWRGDEEFGPEANVLFDKSISDIFCTEDIVILAELLTHNI